jgi:hypothetical protein
MAEFSVVTQYPSSLNFNTSSDMDRQQLEYNLQLQQQGIYNGLRESQLYQPAQQLALQYTYPMMPMHNPMVQDQAHMHASGCYDSGMNMPDGMGSMYIPHQSMMGHPMSNQKLQDEPDSACRPRLTADQTRELENAYTANPKPTTDEKKTMAKRLCLSDQKVNVSTPILILTASLI